MVSGQAFKLAKFSERGRRCPAHASRISQPGMKSQEVSAVHVLGSLFGALSSFPNWRLGLPRTAGWRSDPSAKSSLRICSTLPRPRGRCGDRSVRCTVSRETSRGNVLRPFYQMHQVSSARLRVRLVSQTRQSRGRANSCPDSRRPCTHGRPRSCIVWTSGRSHAARRGSGNAGGSWSGQCSRVPFGRRTGCLSTTSPGA